MRPNTRRGFTLIELLTVIAIIGILAGVLFPAIGSVKKKSKIATSQTTFSQWCSAVSRYKSVYSFYPNIGSKYDTGADALHKLEDGTGLKFIKALSGKKPSGGLLSAGTTGDRMTLNRNAEEFCAFAKEDYYEYGVTVDSKPLLMDKLGNVNIRVIFDTDNTGSIKNIPIPPVNLPIDLNSAKTEGGSGIDTSTGIPARVIIFTTNNDIAGNPDGLGKDDLADIIAIQ